jgi:hypothetical protein
MIITLSQKKMNEELKNLDRDALFILAFRLKYSDKDIYDMIDMQLFQGRDDTNVLYFLNKNLTDMIDIRSYWDKGQLIEKIGNRSVIHLIGDKNRDAELVNLNKELIDEFFGRHAKDFDYFMNNLSVISIYASFIRYSLFLYQNTKLGELMRHQRNKIIACVVLTMTKSRQDFKNHLKYCEENATDFFDFVDKAKLISDIDQNDRYGNLLKLEQFKNPDEPLFEFQIRITPYIKYAIEAEDMILKNSVKARIKFKSKKDGIFNFTEDLRIREVVMSSLYV